MTRMYEFADRLRPFAKADQPRQWYRIVENKASKKSTARVDIYDVIDSWFGVSAKDLIAELNELDVKTIDLHINSPGGAAYDGIAIYNALMDHDATVNVTVDGMAASAASVIAMAGESITMNRASQMMIHDASGLCWGNAKDMEETADFLNRLSDDIASVYSERAGGSIEDWREAMRAETWYNAEEAVEAGLATKLARKKKDDGDAEPTNQFDLSIFNFAGRDKAPPPRLDINKTSAVAIDTKSIEARDNVPANGQGDASMTQQAEAETPKEEVEKETPETEPEETPETEEGKEESTPEQAPAAQNSAKGSVPETVLVDKAQFEAMNALLQQNSQELAQIKAEKVAAENKAYLDAAQAAGKFRATDRASYEAYLESKPAEARAHIDKLAANTVPVEEIGHGSAENKLPDDAFPAWMMAGLPTGADK